MCDHKDYKLDEIDESTMNEQKARARAAWTGSGDKSFEKFGLKF